jgi:hypothetical protein
MEKRYTVCEFENLDSESWQPYVIHKVGCERTKDEKFMARLDLEEDTDEELLEAIEAPLEYKIEDVELCACTGYAPEPVVPQEEEPDEDDEEEDEDATPSSPAAIASQQAARAKLQKQVEEVIDKLVAKRGSDDVGEGDKWSNDRLFRCTDDYVYDLAVEVRKMRELGEPWWRVAYELGLPGSGATNKQGRRGSALARRLWRAAWGKTYGETRSQRESKAAREERAARNEGRPYFPKGATEMEVVKAVTGSLIHWVARLPVVDGLVFSSQEAYVHADPHLVRYKLGPQGPYIEFYEQVDPAQLLVDPHLSIAKSGPLRAVYVDRITRVGV